MGRLREQAYHAQAGESNNRNGKYQFWQQENHPLECFSNDILFRFKYLHENPVRAGIIGFEHEYIYSGGIDYYSDQKGLLEIDFT